MPLWGALTKKLPDVSPKIVQLDSRHIENQKTYAQLYHKIDRSLSKREKSVAVQNPNSFFGELFIQFEPVEPSKKEFWILNCTTFLAFRVRSIDFTESCA